MPLLSNIAGSLKRFLSDERGAAGIEFLTTLPLLIGTMVFTAEYGNALRTKMVLNTATADVTRFLARAPLEESTTNEGQYQFYSKFLTDAQAMMEARMGGSVALSTEIFIIDSEGLPFDLRTDPVIVQVRTDVGLSMPLLGFINQTIEWANNFSIITEKKDPDILPTLITMASQLNAVWVGGSEVGAADCRLINRELDLCDVEEAGSS
ncbi:MAG: TadE/TadG family type IV pilus assembly protein [Pseudomonadota bacterium]